MQLGMSEVDELLRVVHIVLMSVRIVIGLLGGVREAFVFISPQSA